MAGNQEKIYAHLFENIAGMIEPGSRIYLQTMVFGPGMVPIEQLSIDAPRESDEWYGALMMKQFPGSWLPYGKEQVVARRPPTWSSSPPRAGGSTTSRRSSSGGAGSPSGASERR